MPHDPPAGRGIYLLSEDLLIASRISASAGASGIPFRRLAPAQIKDLPPSGGILFLDLDVGLDAADLAVQAARNTGPSIWHIVGYGSHVDSDGLKGLKALGVDRVLSRSHLVTQLEGILKEAFSHRR